MKLQMRFSVRTVTMAVFAAVVGFSYAIVSQASPSVANLNPVLGSRALGSGTIRLLAPAYTSNSADADLGDALFGSAFTRYVTATGGIRPYVFSGAGLPAAPSTLTVDPSGIITGLISSSGAPSTITFTVFVSGSKENDINNSISPTGQRLFHLAMFPTGSQVFRFSHDHLNNGVLGQSYVAKVDTIGGKGFVKTTIVAGSVTLNGIQIGTGNSLEDSLGLSFAYDGTLYGRPLKTGLVAFRVHAVDASRRVAKDRSNSVDDQLYSFNVEDARVTASDATVLAVSVKGDTAIVNGDTVKFKAYMNLGGRNTTDLVSQISSNGTITKIDSRFAVIFGGNTYVGYFNSSGKVLNQLGGPLIFPDGTALKCTVDSVNGTITGQLLRANVAAGLNAAGLTNLSTKRIGFAILVHNILVACDTIEFTTKHIGTKYALNYSLGKLGRPLGGVFQVYDVRGSDGPDIAGNPGDAWTAKFLIAPRFGIDSLENESTPGYDNINNISVRIGTNFVQTTPVVIDPNDPSKNGFKIKPKDGSIYLATTDPVFNTFLNVLTINPATSTGLLVTKNLDINTTGMPQGKSQTTATRNFYNMAIDINRGSANDPFSGEDAKSVLAVPTNNKWVDRNTKRPKP